MYHSPVSQFACFMQAFFSAKKGRQPTRPSAKGSREYLTPAEVRRLMDVAGKNGRHRHRDRALILIAFRHALRVSELGSSRLETGTATRQAFQERQRPALTLFKDLRSAPCGVCSGTTRKLPMFSSQNARVP